MQYSHTKYGNTEYFRSHLSIVLFPFFSHLGQRGHPSLFHPCSLLRVSNNEYLFLQFCCYKCVLSIFIYNRALQNTDFGVLQKPSKHFLISFSFHLGGGTPPPCPTRSVLRASNNEDLFLQFCCYKCVLSIFIYNIALQNTDLGVLQKSSKHFLISIFFPLGEGDTPSLSHLPLLGTSGLEQ